MTQTQAVDRPKIIWLNMIFLLGTPLLALVLVPWYALTHGITWAQVAVAASLWFFTGVGITAGYHRLFSHRSYKATAPVRFVFAILGAATWQNSIITWCAGHRYHHRDVDTDGDPYNAKKGLLWSHIGWILVEGSRHDKLDNVDDLWKDPICAWQHRFYLPISIAFNVGVVLLMGWATGQYLGMAIIAGLLRVVLVHHFTFTINSLAHYWGHQRWSTSNTSRDNWFISLVSFGEGYHNYHHAFQTDYRNGAIWYNYDPSKWLIWSMDRLGLAKDLRWAHADIVLRKRYEDRCATFSQWLEEKKDRLRLEKHEVLESLQARAVFAQDRLDEALDELRSARRAWTDLRMGQSHLMALERKAIKRAYRHHIRVVKASMREWETLLADTMALHSAALAAA